MNAARASRGAAAAALAILILVAAAGGPSTYFATWPRSALVVVSAVVGLAFGYNINFGAARTLPGPTVVAGLVFPPEIATFVIAVQRDVHPDRFPWLRADATWLRVVGLVLVAGGGLVQVWSQRVLGRHYIGQVGLLEGHELVRRGPYRVVRHPAYGAELVSDIGAGFALGSWIGVACALVIFPVLAYRATREDRMLREAFGDEAAAMQRDTWQLVPFVH